MEFIQYKEEFKTTGYFRIEGYDVDTGEKVIDTGFIKNVLTDVNRQYRQSMLDGSFQAEGLTIDGLQIRYVALGDGTNAAAADDTQLQNELIRRPITRISSSGQDTTSITVFLTDVANFRIREIGVFSGPNATMAANSGTLISRINVDVIKNSNIVLNVNRIDRTVI